MKKKQFRGHLRFDERQVIHLMRAKGKSFAEIGRVIGRDRSVVWRELKRNKAPDVISREMSALEKAKYADDKARNRRRASKKGIRKLKLASVRIKIEEFLKENRDSPETISIRLSKETESFSVSGKTIRRWLLREAKNLREFLPEKGKKRKKRLTPRKVRFGSGTSIHQRPKIVNANVRVGDYEADAVVCSSSKEAIISVRERKLRKGWFEKVENLKADSVRRALIRIFKDIPEPLRLTCTFDNGSEFAEFATLEKLFGIETYFCDPYSSWQKGTVENLNKALRVFIPKKTNIAEVSTEYLRKVQEIINNKPMLCLNKLSPNQAWQNHLDSI